MKKMKMNNKGFSLVELIIVIAIMAILAGALAPALIKYVAKSRRSSDISNAQTLATGITTALSSEKAADDASDVASWTPITAISGASFASEVNNNVQGGVTSFNVKTGKLASTGSGSGTAFKNDNAYYAFQLDTSTNIVKVAIVDGDGHAYELYPNVDPAMKD